MKNVELSHKDFREFVDKTIMETVDELKKECNIPVGVSTSILFIFANNLMSNLSKEAEEDVHSNNA